VTCSGNKIYIFKKLLRGAALLISLIQNYALFFSKGGIIMFLDFAHCLVFQGAECLGTCICFQNAVFLKRAEEGQSAPSSEPFRTDLKYYNYIASINILINVLLGVLVP
jgi:hypothetical protein